MLYWVKIHDIFVYSTFENPCISSYIFNLSCCYSVSFEHVLLDIFLIWQKEFNRDGITVFPSCYCQYWVHYYILNNRQCWKIMLGLVLALEELCPFKTVRQGKTNWWWVEASHMTSLWIMGSDLHVMQGPLLIIRFSFTAHYPLSPVTACFLQTDQWPCVLASLFGRGETLPELVRVIFGIGLFCHGAFCRAVFILPFWFTFLSDHCRIESFGTVWLCLENMLFAGFVAGSFD